MTKRVEEGFGTTRFEEDRSWENQARCPGFRLVTLEKLAGPQETLVRCIDPHPHQVILRIVQGLYGEERHEERRYPWVTNLASEPEARASAARLDAWRTRKEAERRASVAAARETMRRITPAEAIEAVTNAPLVLQESPRLQLVPPPEDDGGLMGDDSI